MTHNFLLRAAALAALGLVSVPAAQATVAANAAPANYTFNTGTFFSSTTTGTGGSLYTFSGKQDLTGANDFNITFSFTGAHGATLFGHNLKFTNGSGLWVANPNLSTTNGTKGVDANGPTLLLSDNNGFFKIPIAQYGDQFSFDLTETGSQSGAPSFLTMTAKDDVATLGTLTFTPSGPTTAVSFAGLPGVTVVPEPSSAAVMIIGVLGLVGLRTRRRCV